MASEYTPTTESVKSLYGIGAYEMNFDDEDGEAAFDRWLAGVWSEAYRAGWRDTDYLDTPNPYEPEL